MSAEGRCWLAYAQENRRAATVCLRSDLFNPCLQNAQQAVEKALKALHLAHGICNYAFGVHDCAAKNHRRFADRGDRPSSVRSVLCQLLAASLPAAPLESLEPVEHSTRVNA